MRLWNLLFHLKTFWQYQYQCFSLSSILECSLRSLTAVVLAFALTYLIICLLIWHFNLSNVWKYFLQNLHRWGLKRLMLFLQRSKFCNCFSVFIFSLALIWPQAIQYYLRISLKSHRFLTWEHIQLQHGFDAGEIKWILVHQVQPSTVQFRWFWSLCERPCVLNWAGK